jgi:hypothetical protein
MTTPSSSTSEGKKRAPPPIPARPQESELDSALQTIEKFKDVLKQEDITMLQDVVHRAEESRRSRSQSRPRDPSGRPRRPPGATSPSPSPYPRGRQPHMQSPGPQSQSSSPRPQSRRRRLPKGDRVATPGVPDYVPINGVDTSLLTGQPMHYAYLLPGGQQARTPSPKSDKTLTPGTTPRKNETHPSDRTNTQG